MSGGDLKRVKAWVKEVTKGKTSSAGTDLDVCVDNNDRTALHLAAKAGNVDVVRLLCEVRTLGILSCFCSLAGSFFRAAPLSLPPFLCLPLTLTRVVTGYM